MQRTLRITQSDVTAHTSVTLVDFVSRNESVAERVEKWYIKPLREMHGPQGFLVLMVLFPLYEKHLRYKHPDLQHFTKGHSVFQTIGRDLKLDRDGAYLLWKNMRNGILHRALPDEDSDFHYIITSEGPAVERNQDIFRINPFEMRDSLLKVIVSDLRMWKADDILLPETMRHLPLS
jgi:hypothetical protein